MWRELLGMRFGQKVRAPPSRLGVPEHAPLSPRPGAPSVPPSRADPPTGRTSIVKNVFCLKLDAKSVPEALATSIRILLMFSIVLAHSRGQIPTFFEK